MFYQNRKEKLKIDLSKLSKSELQFYGEALKSFRSNVPWLEFEAFAFGRDSLVYVGRQSRIDLRSDPLYLALLDMWTELGIRQGAMSRATEEERTEFAKGRKEGGGRKAQDGQNREAERDLATAR